MGKDVGAASATSTTSAGVGDVQCLPIVISDVMGSMTTWGNLKSPTILFSRDIHILGSFTLAYIIYKCQRHLLVVKNRGDQVSGSGIWTLVV